MGYVKILPADTYTVINKSIITDKDRKNVSMLYQPIIGFAAISLYFSLIDDLDKREFSSEDLTHHHLMATMQLSLEGIVSAREKLEAVGLLKSYYKKDNINHFVYLLYSPMTPIEFFNHPILNVVLFNNLGKVEYEKILNLYKIPKINLKEYEDITCSFDQVFSSISGNNVEYNDSVVNSEKSNIIINKNIDFDLILSSFSNGQISDKCFNDEIRELINSLAYVYNLNSLDMQGIIRDCINEKGMIDKTLLRKSCRNYYKFENAGNLPTLIYNKQPDFLRKPEGDNSKRAKMIYTFEKITPYQLLKAKYKGGEPTDRDKNLIENLLVNLKLNPGVVNVLISYVLKINNEQLTKAYVETIAGQWKRLNIETVEDAMNIAEKEHKKIKKAILKSKTEKSKSTNTVKVKNSEDPIWFNKDNDIVETSSEEQEEFDKLLNELV